MCVAAAEMGARWGQGNSLVLIPNDRSKWSGSTPTHRCTPSLWAGPVSNALFILMTQQRSLHGAAGPRRCRSCNCYENDPWQAGHVTHTFHSTHGSAITRYGVSEGSNRAEGGGQTGSSAADEVVGVLPQRLQVLDVIRSASQAHSVGEQALR